MDIFEGYKKHIKDYHNTYDEDLIVIGKGKNAIGINFVPAGFDIETYTQYEKNKKGKVVCHYTNMYIWQFGFDDLTFFGRTWSDFSELLYAIEEIYCKAKKKFLFFIHNLSFESAFAIKELIARGHKIEVFSREPRHPMKLVIDDKIIVLDSMRITGFSLEKLAKNFTKTQKLKGDLDYTIPRNKFSKLTEQELAYCRNDVRILVEYAEIYKTSYMLNGFLPMTATMIANRAINDNIKELKATDEVHKTIYYNYPKSMEQYNYIMSFFAGAYTHGMLENLFYTHDCGTLAYDITSEYPFVLLARYNAMGTFKPLTKKTLTNKELMQKTLDNYCVLVNCTFSNIRTKTGVTILSENKIEYTNATFDNGRLYNADSATANLCEVDLITLSLHYEWDEITYNHGIYTTRGFLPKYYRLAIANLYDKKSRLKGKEGYEVEYMQSKQSLNGLYGALACKVTEIEQTIDELGNWITKPQNQDFSKLRQTKKTLPQWSIWCTAWARLLILENVKACIDLTYGKNKQNGKSLYFYSDTDSIKVGATKEVIEHFNNYNKTVREQNKKWIEELELNKKYPNTDFAEMGTFTNETMDKKGNITPLKRFKTLGSKRYLVEHHDGTFESTVAGLSKTAFLSYCKSTNKDPFELFNNDGLDLTDDQTQKLGAFYKDEPQQFTVTDLEGNTEEITTESYVSLIPISFKLTINDKLVMLHDEIIKQDL